MAKLFDVILIETKNVCTRTCWFCKFGQERQDDAIVEMDWQTIERIVANLKRLKFRGRISWFWINEPLLERRMLEILKLTRKHCPRAFLSLITNGDLLTDDKYKELRSNGLDALGVSIYDDKTFQKVEQLKRDERLVAIDMREPPPGSLHNRAGNIKHNVHLFEDFKHEFLDRSCSLPSTMLTVNPKGQVVLCCADMYSDVVMGDVTEQLLEDIWNNSRFHHYRQTLSERGRKNLPLCDGCSHEGYGPSRIYPLRASPEVGLLSKTRLSQMINILKPRRGSGAEA
jgi:radical SAM protein with 4Fe4S-binding SPASM domain